MRNREAEVQEKIGMIRGRLEEGLRSLPKHDHLKNLSVEYEPVDYQTLTIHFSKASFFTEADIEAIKEIVGGIHSCQITQDVRNKLRLSLTVLM